MDKKEEIIETHVIFKEIRYALSLVGYGITWEQIGHFNGSTKDAISLDEYIRLGATAADIYFEYFKFEITTHYLVLTEIGETLALIAFPKAAGKFTNDHRERIKYLLQLKYKNTPQEVVLEKIGSVNYRPPKQNSSGHIVITDEIFKLNPTAEKLLSKYYPSLYKESLFNLYRIIYYECELLGITPYALFQTSNSLPQFKFDDNFNYVDTNGQKLPDRIYYEITEQIPPISAILTVISKLGYLYFKFDFFLKIAPYEWDSKNILKHIEINRESSITPFVDFEITNDDTNILIETTSGTFPLPFPVWEFLDGILPFYQGIIDNTPNEIIKRHAEIREDIEDWLKDRFKYSAKNLQGFVKWILNNKVYPPFGLSYDIYIRHFPIFNMWSDLRIDFPKWDIEVLEEDLIRYCEMRVQELNSKLQNGTSPQSKAIFDSIMYACTKLQADMTYWSSDENPRNTFVRNIVGTMYNVKDQSLYGESSSGKSSGELDLIIFSSGTSEKPLTICEGLNVESMDRVNLDKHLKKLESKYDKWGLEEKYLLVYTDINGSFADFSGRYRDFIENYAFKYKREEEIEPINTGYTDLTIYKTIHKREGKRVYLYHFLIKMPKK